MDKKIIEKYLNNNCSDGELNIILDWFSKSVHTAESKTLLFNIWEDIPEQEARSGADFDSILSKIHHEINIRQSKIIVEKSENDLIRFTRRQHFVTLIRNAAAILLLPILGLGIFFSTKYYSAKSNQKSISLTYNEVYASVDAITKVILPDGTNVWLNHSSSLRYPATFQGKFRNVELVGEGYFEVAHNSRIPFIVNTGDLQIEALGTTFNVMAYPDENRIETSLINGIVEIKKFGKDRKIENIYKMKPTDLTIYDKNSKEVFIKTINDDRYFSWKDGKLVFTSEPMEEVVKKLSRWFNVDIQIKDHELKDLTLTATFVNETLPQVMELLTFVSPVSYTISDRKEINDGTFSRSKVILSYRRF